MAVAAAALLTGAARAADIATGVQAAGTKGDGELARGARVYRMHCALCHGASGEGYEADHANALANQDFLISVSDEFLRRSIANGRPDTPMAAHARRFGGPLDNADIDALIALMRSWQHEPSADIASGTIAGDPAAGRNAYATACAKCHGDHGQGVKAVSLNNPEFLASASDGQIRRAIVHGRRGTPMPAFEDRLPDDTINDMVALIRSWQREVPKRVVHPKPPEIRNVVLNPDGPSPHFSLKDGRYVTVEQLDAAIRNGKRLVLLDARPASDWYRMHIQGAVSAPHHDPASIIARLPRDGTWIVSYCACPHKYSDDLTNKLRSAGFPNTAVLYQGLDRWRQKALPMEYER